MMWKDYLKLSEIASYSKLARASTPPPPRPNRVKKLLRLACIVVFEDCYLSKFAL